MGKVTNTFIKSKLNKDLDARILPNGEYRDAQNVQVSRSEGANVGSLENSLGNVNVENYTTITDNPNLQCIGVLPDDTSNTVFLFFTDHTYSVNEKGARVAFSPTASNYIYRYDIASSTSVLLVTGAFLNFSKEDPIYGVNLLEDLLFWTDNRNQPRKINVNTANPNNLPIPTYYTNEDQISVAKYNPYRSIELFKPYDTFGIEATMKDVTSKYFPDGGSATAASTAFNGDTTIEVKSIKGNILASLPSPPNKKAATVSYIDATGMVSTGLTVNSISYNPSTSITTVTLSGPLVLSPAGVSPEWVFDANTYWDKDFAGDPNYLEDKFVRFSYRFRFDDGEYSIFAPFTQVAFIPKQDGYFMYVKNDSAPAKDDQSAAYKSTVVSWMENKVNDISLYIPLPDVAAGDEALSGLKIAEVDILYKESNGLAVKVIETIKASDLDESGNHWVYDYKSSKPFKTLPEDEIIRVYDKTPVRAFAQEIISNRVVYGNYQNKHTPPAFLNYNVIVSEKSPINLNLGNGRADGDSAGKTTVSITAAQGAIVPGSVISGWAAEPLATVFVVTIDPAKTLITTNIDTGVILNNELLNFTPPSEASDRSSVVEYPNHSVKQNRSYQIGVVLSDRYGRQSTVILSNNAVSHPTLEGDFLASTIFAPYKGVNPKTNSWPGDSLKIVFNDPISPSSPNQSTGWPGLWDGDVTSDSYNPLGWYSYKIVVKQTEQEYYNVYLPGIMAAYPDDANKELGNTSHMSLINDNINKVPRDLTEVGPDQKQYRSSVNLYGRVENSSTTPTYNTEGNRINVGSSNVQYYPENLQGDTVSTIATMRDLFDYDPASPPAPDWFSQFYLSESNPLIARVSTDEQIGQIYTVGTNPLTGVNTPEFAIFSAVTVGAVTDSATLSLTSISNIAYAQTACQDFFVYGAGIPEGTRIEYTTLVPNYTLVDDAGNSVECSIAAGTLLQFRKAFTQAQGGELVPSPLQQLAIYETEPVESNLDIFWETSTSGTIAGLNKLILNPQDVVPGAIKGWDPTGWTEALDYLSPPSYILTESFNLLNSLGQSVILVPSQGDSFELLSVLNSNNENVQLIGASEPLPANQGYFLLEDLSSPGNPSEFQISIKKQYWDAIYFGNNAALRSFKFTFKSVVNSVETIYEEYANLENIRVNQAPLVVSCGDVVQTNRRQEDIVNFYGFNGAANEALKGKEVAWRVLSQVDIANPNTQVDFFAMKDPSETGTPNWASSTWLQNISVNNIPTSIYNVVVEASDAASVQTCSLELRMEVTPTVWDYNFGDTACPVEVGGAIDSAKFCVIYVPEAQSPGNGGYYIPWNKQNWDYNGVVDSVGGFNPGGANPTITLSPTSTTPGFTSWVYDVDLATAITTYLNAVEITCPQGDLVSSEITYVSNVTFEVIP